MSWHRQPSFSLFFYKISSKFSTLQIRCPVVDFIKYLLILYYRNMLEKPHSHISRKQSEFKQTGYCMTTMCNTIVCTLLMNTLHPKNLSSFLQSRPCAVWLLAVPFSEKSPIWLEVLQRMLTSGLMSRRFSRKSLWRSVRKRWQCSGRNVCASASSRMGNISSKYQQKIKMLATKNCFEYSKFFRRIFSSLLPINKFYENCCFSASVWATNFVLHSIDH